MKTIEGDSLDHESVSELKRSDTGIVSADLLRGAIDHVGYCGTCGCEVGIKTWNENNGQCNRHADPSKRWID